MDDIPGFSDDLDFSLPHIRRLLVNHYRSVMDTYVEEGSPYGNTMDKVLIWYSENSVSVFDTEPFTAELIVDLYKNVTGDYKEAGLPFGNSIDAMFIWFEFGIRTTSG